MTDRQLVALMATVIHSAAIVAWAQECDTAAREGEERPEYPRSEDALLVACDLFEAAEAKLSGEAP